MLNSKLASQCSSTAGAVLMVLVLAAGTFAQESHLGTVDFPTSGSPEAQKYFLRGLAALHSFWYEEALENFSQAVKVDPDFMMGYWGEAMTYNHPLWAQQNTQAGQDAVAKIHDTPRLTPREKAYLAAIHALYGEGDKLARDIAYSDAMSKIYHDYPDDMEAACFYALSLLGTVRPGDKGFKRQMQAGAIAMEVYRKNPDHPGAAHYIIHAFDDPDHAILALPAARRYAEIAPEASHARHMPSHIFVQLGMWNEAAAANESAWQVSDAWSKAKNYGITARDYHSLHWLTYVYLQQGRYSKASGLISLLKDAIAQQSSQPMIHSLENMSAEYVIETENWDKGAEMFGNPDQAKAGTAKATEQPGPGGHAAMSYDGGDGMLSLYAVGFAAAESGHSDGKAAATLHERAAQILKAGQTYRSEQIEILALEIDAVSAAGRGDFDSAVKAMKKAISVEDQMSPPSGPPDSIKPPRELLGDLLLKAGRPKEALEQFNASLAREPNRARSLLGKARALARSGDSARARETYTDFLEMWKQADAGLPEAKEARGYLDHASVN
ncbi:MAG TPA: tetratricopeptide repeat protein [Blastocatellia bacterium]